jgi:hypothetical protein
MNLAVVNKENNEVINVAVVNDLTPEIISMFESEYPNHVFVPITEETGPTCPSGWGVHQKWNGLFFYKEYDEGYEPTTIAVTQ